MRVLNACTTGTTSLDHMEWDSCCKALLACLKLKLTTYAHNTLPCTILTLRRIAPPWPKGRCAATEMMKLVIYTTKVLLSASSLELLCLFRRNLFQSTLQQLSYSCIAVAQCAILVKLRGRMAGQSFALHVVRCASLLRALAHRLIIECPLAILREHRVFLNSRAMFAINVSVVAEQRLAAGEDSGGPNYSA